MKVEEFLDLLRGVKPSGNGWVARCPAHEDHNPSLSIKQKGEKILVKCLAGCPTETVLNTLGLKWSDLFVKGKGCNKPVGNRCNTATPPQNPQGLTLEQLAKAKKLQADRLREWGCSNQKKGVAQVLRIPYLAPSGEEVAIRYRCALSGPDRFRWRKGSHVCLYGLWFLSEFKKRNWILLAEGESDSWSAWTHGIPALGIPGKSTWRSEWTEYLEGFQEVYLWQEPEAEDLTLRVGADIPGLKVIPAPDGVKDLSEAHIQGRDVPQLLGVLKAKAIPARDIIKAHKDARIKELREKAAPILAAENPLMEVKKALREMGVGGDLRPALITYLAATSRLLQMRRGAMPVHLLLLGQSSTGKSYVIDVVLSLLPGEAFQEISAGSPRALIYDDADLRHKLVVFGEADSLPAGEDNPAASAIRNLLQDHYLHYDVTVRDKDTGEYKVKHVRKPGPTALLTTSTRRLGHQFDTRTFSLDIPDDGDQIRAALKAQARAELEGIAPPDENLIAFQACLQALAPWEVYVPFVGSLADLIEKKVTAPRILRDFSRLVSFIKAVAILRHAHRERDGQGRVVATLEDYETVQNLVNPMYEATLTGASEGVREVVHTVLQLLEEGCNTSQSEIAKRLNLNKGTVSRRVHAALKGGWLINEEIRKGYPWRLKPGEPLPEKEGLPTVEEVKERCCRVAGVTDGNKEHYMGEDSAVSPLKGDKGGIPDIGEPPIPHPPPEIEDKLDEAVARLQTMQEKGVMTFPVFPYRRKVTEEGIPNPPREVEDKLDEEAVKAEAILEEKEIEWNW